MIDLLAITGFVLTFESLMAGLWKRESIAKVIFEVCVTVL